MRDDDLPVVPLGSRSARRRRATAMRLPNAVQQEHPWVISRIAPDFKLLDVWALPVRGSANEFPTLLEVMAALDPTGAESWR